MVVNTKASVRDFREDTILTYEGVLGQLRLSLAELGREKVNIFYLHQPDQRAVLEDALRACNELHRQGLFAELGLSNFPAWQVVQVYYKCRAEGWVLPTVYQVHYNPLFRQPEDELIPAVRMLGMRIHCCEPTISPQAPISRSLGVLRQTRRWRPGCWVTRTRRAASHSPTGWRASRGSPPRSRRLTRGARRRGCRSS